MAWDGVERRAQTTVFNGPDRRAAAYWRVPKRVTMLKDEQVRELARQRRRDRLEGWEAAEYLE